MYNDRYVTFIKRLKGGNQKPCIEGKQYSYDGQREKDERTSKDLQNTTQKTKD